MEHSEQQSTVQFVLIVLTYNCNNRCKWCYAKPSKFLKQAMPIESAKKYLQLAKRLGATDVGLIGGEPTLYPDLILLIKTAKELGLATTLYSNGRKFSDKDFTKNIRNAGTGFVNISIQSVSPKQHDLATGVGGSLNETFLGIENCFRERLNTRLMTVLAHKNIETYKLLVKRFLPDNPLFVFFREVPAINCRTQKTLPDRESAKIIEKLFRFCKNKKAKAHFYPRMSLGNFNEAALKEMIAEKAISNSCYAQKGSGFAIDVNGGVLPCVQWIGKASFNLIEKNRVISRKSFLEKWNSKKLQKLRKRLSAVCANGCPLAEGKV